MKGEDPNTRLVHCADKLSFLSDALAGAGSEVSEEGIAGLAFIIIGIEAELREVAGEVLGRGTVCK